MILSKIFTICFQTVRNDIYGGDIGMVSEYMCPLLNQVIDDRYCYDVKMVAYGYIKPEALADKINR